MNESRRPTQSRSRRALGRGLDVLIPSAPPSGYQEIPIGAIDPNPAQPRQRFDREALGELAASIREHGIMQPLVVSAGEGGRYCLIVGERRLQAAKLAGVEHVPAVVRETTDRQSLELALVENIQRADLNPLEEGAAYARLIREFGLTQQQVAQQVGRSRVAIANVLRLLELPATVKRALAGGRITEGHARALLGVKSEQTQLAILERIERDGLTVRQTEELARRLVEPSRPAERPVARNPNVEAVEEELRRALGTGVTLRPGKRGGKIVIEYYSDEDFQSLYDRLTR